MSRELSQPFVVNHINITSSVVLASTIRVVLGLVKGNTPPTSLTGGFSMLLPGAINDQSVPPQLWTDAEPFLFNLGTIISDVPTRLAVILDNVHTANILYSVVWNITHLCPVPSAPESSPPAA